MTIAPGHAASAAATAVARRRVEVVGRLVEQQQVVAAGHQLRERELRLLAARQRARVLERLVAAQAEHAEQAAQLDVGR